MHAVSLALGWCEVVAAVLFLVPRIVAIGAYSLVGVFVLAAALHLAHGEYDIVPPLAVWTTAVLAVLAHRRPDSAEPAARPETVQ
jgi:hypothetical protein